MNLNENYQRLSDTDPYAVIDKKVSDWQYKNPDTVILRLDTEDATADLPTAVSQAMEEAAVQLRNNTSLRRVPPCNGYPFLLQAIRDYYARREIQLFESEIFVNNGGKCDIVGILELASSQNTVLITEPFNPLYYNSNLVAGRNIRFIPTDEKNDYLPLPDEEHADIIYLCSPSNPTGAVMDRAVLKKWVEYALFHNALILFDASYEAFVTNPELPRSIYEIEGAKKCALEICSLSKAAGFANTRLGYTVIPNNLIVDSMRLNQLWMRRERLKFNGVSYIVQKGAEAAFSTEGQNQIKDLVDFYLANTRQLASPFITNGLCGEKEIFAPHLWIRCPENMSSWECFDALLNQTGIAAIPGSIFGSCGENHMKLTGYTTRDNIHLAIQRLNGLFESGFGATHD